MKKLVLNEIVVAIIAVALFAVSFLNLMKGASEGADLFAAVISSFIAAGAGVFLLGILVAVAIDYILNKGRSACFIAAVCAAFATLASIVVGTGLCLFVLALFTRIGKEAAVFAAMVVIFAAVTGETAKLGAIDYARKIADQTGLSRSKIRKSLVAETTLIIVGLIVTIIVI